MEKAMGSEAGRQADQALAGLIRRGDKGYWGHMVVGLSIRIDLKPPMWSVSPL
jgi:hypothetical protein